MRVLTLAPALLLLAAAGCASTATTDRYATDMQKLAEDCAAQGGILAPTGRQSGRPNTDNFCKLTSATRLPRSE
ncbi:hypothetical protein [Brevundimonas sp.]|uniref:hypothetical protein n=1 Tax=Brevundimonas sp. TaxID=1871086 RepID=UPI002FC87BD7